MNPRWILRTARLLLTPVNGADLPDLIAIKGDPRVFAVMLGGVRSPTRTQEELARDVVAWGAEGFGIWTIREAGGNAPRINRAAAGFVGITGLERRPDGRGVALRFALWPDSQGRGLAREAAGAALRFGHDEAGLRRIVAVARASNFASRMVLGGIGMTACDSFTQNGWPMVLYESRSPSPMKPERIR
ncbi:MAG TPA: GNAT family N-acetyltransferase [Acetobacteraceae bacterium]|jgi:RimJ/RimL family protein N-acetyltransferase|nr:GNAT family N-acetyltransferase [Acetobacteraceae bacterium]